MNIYNVSKLIFLDMKFTRSRGCKWVQSKLFMVYVNWIQLEPQILV